MENTRLQREQKKQIISSIKDKTKKSIENRKNANDVLDIISYLQNEDAQVVLASISSVHKIFCRFISTGEMFLERSVEDRTDDLTKEEQYRVWLQDRYCDCVGVLLDLLYHSNSSVKELSLSTLMKFVSGECDSPLVKVKASQSSFPLPLYQRILSQLLSETENTQELLVKFQEFLLYDDVRFNTLKFVLVDIKARQEKSGSDTCLLNVFTLLDQIDFPSSGEDTLSNFLCKPPANVEVRYKAALMKEQKKVFTSVWLQFLRFKLPTSLYKRVLVMLHEKVMPYMTSPLQLSDFLTESYNIGGAISLLALNGLFILVHKYNLDYPDFYKKLYALFEPSVFHVKYRARFFFLSDLFLTSSHLPAYLVAAFVKKLARISLTAPPTGLAITIPFIYNLISRHPNCKCLLNRSETLQDETSDPFKLDEPDPAKCNALESSLWELKTLQHHFYPDVSLVAQKIETPLKTEEIPIAEFLDTTTDEIFAREQKKKIKTVPVTFEPLKGLFDTKDDKIKLCWSYT